MNCKSSIFGIFFLLMSFSMASQQFPRKDSLKGSITKERAWWNLLHYEIDLIVDIPAKSLSGANTIRYQVIDKASQLQIDLQSPMKIVSVKQDGKYLTWRKEYSACFITLNKSQEPGSIEEITIQFEGSPQESTNPPWDGGFIWRNDVNKQPFIANANQLLGSSCWLPSKDIPYDEPDQGLQMSLTVPSGLTGVSNGRLTSHKTNDNGTDTFEWEVVNPINGYGINISIGDYTHFTGSYSGEKGILDLNYFVLRDNLEPAKKQFQQVPKMLEAFEHWFGPYPFYEDGFKLVEVPYLGMEHQSAVTYGNGYKNGYLGGDLSFTGEGLKFDFIIIHESGHEWFANSLTNDDVADMWIHEGFTTYSEVLYLDYHFGKASGDTYLKGIREQTINNYPITGSYSVDQRGSDDMYWKGAAMIHTLRQFIDDDETFRNLLRGINKTFYHKTLSSAELESYIMEELDTDLVGFFEQYLRTIRIPVIQYKIRKGTLSYRYRKIVEGFNMPLRFYIDREIVWLTPSEEWQKFKLPAENSTVRIDDNFYIEQDKK